MTCVMASRSRPRAATSVATSTSTLALLEPLQRALAGLLASCRRASPRRSRSCAFSCRTSRSDRPLRADEDERELALLCSCSELDELRRPCRAAGTGTNRWSIILGGLSSRLRPRGGSGRACTRRRSARRRRRASPRRTSSAVLRQPAHDPVDLRLEPHVQHAVGLVQDEDLDARQLDGVAVARSCSRPGVAIRMWASSTPFACSRTPCRRSDGHAAGPWPRRSGRSRRAPAARARAWARAPARAGRFESDGSSRSTIGIANAERLAGAGLRLRQHVAPGIASAHHHRLDRERARRCRPSSAATTGSETPRIRKTLVISLRRSVYSSNAPSNAPTRWDTIKSCASASDSRSGARRPGRTARSPIRSRCSRSSGCSVGPDAPPRARRRGRAGSRRRCRARSSGRGGRSRPTSGRLARRPGSAPEQLAQRRDTAASAGRSARAESVRVLDARLSVEPHDDVGVGRAGGGTMRAASGSRRLSSATTSFGE